MRFFVTSKAKVGSPFNTNSFTLRVMMHYPASQKAAFEESLRELAEVEKFVVQSEGEYRLSEAGAIHNTPEPPDISRSPGRRNFRR